MNYKAQKADYRSETTREGKGLGGEVKTKRRGGTIDYGKDCGCFYECNEGGYPIPTNAQM